MTINQTNTYALLPPCTLMSSNILDGSENGEK